MRIERKVVGAALFLSVIACLNLAARAAPAADLSVLKLVPEDALAIVLINHLDNWDAQIGKLAQEMQIPVPSVLTLLKRMAGIQEGLDGHGAAVLAILPGDSADAAPMLIKFIPVTDYKKFIGQFNSDDASAEIVEVTIGGRPVAVGHKDNFAVLARKEDKDALKKTLDSSRSIAPVVAALSGWIGEHEMSFVATPTGVKQGLAAARKGLTQFNAMMANANDPTAKMTAANFEIYDWFVGAAEREVSAFGCGAHVDNDGGLHIDTRTLFAPGGSWAASGKGLGRPEGSKLASLPGGSFMMAFDGVMPTSFSRSFLNLSVDMINNMSKANGGKALTEDQIKQINELTEKSMGDLRSMSMVMGLPKPGSSLYGNTVAVMKVKNSQQYMAHYQKAMESMGEVMKQAASGLPVPQDLKKVKVNDMDGLEMTMDMSKMFAKMPNNPAMKPMMQMMFGPEGKLDAFIVPIDETIVAMSYINTDNIARVKDALKNPQASLAADNDIAQTAKLLPPGAQFVVYMSPKGLMDFVSAIMLGFAPPGAGMPALPPFPQTPPIGIGAEVSGKGMDLNIVLPGAALKGVGTYVQQMQQMFMPRRQPQIR